MAHSPPIPDPPRLTLDPGLTDEERLSVLLDHYAEVVHVNDALASRLETAEKKRDTLRQRADELARSNAALKTAPRYVATVDECFDGEAIITQHGSNQEVVVEIPPPLLEALRAGDRVAVDDSFGIETVLEAETDARAQAMEVTASPSVSYGDIGGLGEQLHEVRETVELPLLEGDRFDAVGIDPPSGVLLYGPPGTGKTMMAKAVANETDATFIKMAGSELVQKFIGEGARLVRDLFSLASEREPAVIFIDEIDAIASRRTESKTAGDAEVQRTMMQLLSEMDGFDDRGEICLVAATNRFDMLDPALLRPGRFDRLIEVPAADEAGRRQILDIHTREMNVADDVDFDHLAALTDGASGADIRAICTEAGMFALRDDRTEIREVDFTDAIEKIERDEERPLSEFTDYAY